MKEYLKTYKFFILGIVFAFLWASASVAAKIGVRTTEPLVLFQFRFFFAGVILLIYARFKSDWAWPSFKEFCALCFFGFLNITVYLSLFVLAITEVAAGIGSLATSLGPVMMSIIGALVLREKIKISHGFGLIIGVAGVYLAVIPLLSNSFATVRGLVYLLLSMLSYSVGSIYFSNRSWSLSRSAINGWQVFMGGVFMFPITVLLNQKPIELNLESCFSIFWLTVPVSIIAVNLWLQLLKIDTIKASFFMFLCPIFGFIFSTVLLNEPFTWHTGVGLVLVLISLYFGQKR